MLILSGGGSGLLAEVLQQPGASRTVLEAQVPYAASALADLLGRDPEQACSESTARAMAMAAFQRARSLAPLENQERLFGLACTASLATDRIKRGAHRAHIAMQTLEATYTAELSLNGNRQEEEDDLLVLLWHALAATLSLPLDGLENRPLTVEETTAPHHWRTLILGEALVHATAPHDGRLLFPGAFNPLHHAHQRMLDIAEARTGLPGAFELSVANVDKPLLDYREIERRLSQFDKPVWLTRLPTFLEKARQFPQTTFVVGVDTLMRVVEPRYYGDSEANRDAALAELAKLGTRFVVFGRELASGFVALSDLALPEDLATRCIEIPKAEFSEDVSSTALRVSLRDT